ncbi:MAG: hypothetical protein M3Y07_00480 [Acidobacteriota bacterium]|nr:hypothetical protein [Acidobacteriota bacterium]
MGAENPCIEAASAPVLTQSASPEAGNADLDCFEYRTAAATDVHWLGARRVALHFRMNLSCFPTWICVHAHVLQPGFAPSPDHRSR